jgi:hypothetical protein
MFILITSLCVVVIGTWMLIQTGITHSMANVGKVITLAAVYVMFISLVTHAIFKKSHKLKL